MAFQPKDFIVTAEGLVFAVVDRFQDEERIPCFLRYRTTKDGDRHKVATEAANALLRAKHPKYLHHCQRRQALLHGVRPADVVEHLRPRQRVRDLLAPQATVDPEATVDPFEARCARLVLRLAEYAVPSSAVGITGSVLVGCHRADSDIDLVLYDETAFRRARAAIPELIRDGVCTALNDAAWQDAYRRRGCALDYDTFVWHELRKHNKALFEGTKFDLSLIVDTPSSTSTQTSTADPDGQACRLGAWHKQGAVQLRATVTDDRRAFHHPARFGIDHPNIGEVLAFTATYTGQAVAGERIEVRGLIETRDDGAQRIIVGTDREAHGQYIRVLR